MVALGGYVLSVPNLSEPIQSLVLAWADEE